MTTPTMPLFTVKITGDLTTTEVYIARGVDPSQVTAQYVMLRARGPLARSHVGDFTYQFQEDIGAASLPAALVCDLRGGYGAAWSVTVTKQGAPKAIHEVSGFIGMTSGHNYETPILKLT